MKLVKLFTLATALMAMVIVPEVHAQPGGGRQGGPVSYTHLTQPTKA